MFIMTVILLQSKLPELYKLDVIRKKLGDVISPTTIVLLQELERFNKLIKRMSVSLSNLQKVNCLYKGSDVLNCIICTSQALAGEVGMSVELDELSKSLYNGHLPSIWRALAPATLKSLGNWMLHFLKRNTQYQQWVSIVVQCTHINTYM